MVKTVVDIPEKLNRGFRAVVGLKYGGRKGALGLAISEALVMWLNANKSTYYARNGYTKRK